ncbi:MAG: DUF3617 family protein [Hyphomonadaceae bacterium]
MRLLAIAATALLAVCAASADTAKDGAIQVKPGKWKWKQETSIMAIPLNEENLECLIPQKARITLSKLARDLEEGCTVDEVVPIAAGYSFKLICKGKTTGNAEATLTHTQTTMTIRARGTANLGPIPAGFSMNADATYQGDCSPAEVAKETERWNKENPGVKP